MELAKGQQERPRRLSPLVKRKTINKFQPRLPRQEKWAALFAGDTAQKN